MPRQKEEIKRSADKSGVKVLRMTFSRDRPPELKMRNSGTAYAAYDIIPYAANGGEHSRPDAGAAKRTAD